MHAIWKGSISFGLVSIPVALYSATEEKDVRFRQVHRADGGRIRYQRICSVDGQEVPYEEIAKGYEVGDGEIIMLTDEDFADLPLTTSRAIEVLEFVPAEQVDPIMYHKAYYLEPQATAGKPYILLRDALTSSDRVAVVKVALRQREQLATLRVRDGVMVLNTMLWPDEVRSPKFGFLDREYEIRPQELAMAGSLIESMADDFKPDAFTDDYRAALQNMIEAKVAGREVVTPPEAPAAPAGTLDLMAALRASVDRAKAGRQEGEGAGTGTGAGTGETPAGPADQDQHQPPAEPTPITAARSAKRTAREAEPEAPKRAAKKRAARSAGKPAEKPAGKRAG